MMMINALRAHFAEFGVVVAQGAANVRKILTMLHDPDECPLPEIGRTSLILLAGHLTSVEATLRDLERKLLAWHRNNEASRRLETIPGIGPITATAIVATVGEAHQFRSGRQFAAWLGLVPRQNSSGGKQRMGRISKRGDAYLRRLLVHGARSLLRWAKQKPDGRSVWLSDLLVRRPANVAIVALANKTARIVWVLLTRKETYQHSTPVTV
jgi:transposase